VYHNVAVAIDAGRLLFNGAPGLLAMAIDTLALERGSRVLHIGTGTGYYTALLAHSVGPDGRVVGIEVDDELARAAAGNLASMPWVDVRNGDGTGGLDEPFDAILVNAGVTHPQAGWLDALVPGGRLLVPLTATMQAMGPIGKGPLLLATRGDDSDRWRARLVTFVAIYSALGLRDSAANQQLGAALKKSPFPPVKSLRRDPHAIVESCWLHTPDICISLE
jgi:protein-L-isoaspartate(D-aspartate) O-methyltransferase